jgi:hypothetical protein
MRAVGKGGGEGWRTSRECPLQHLVDVHDCRRECVWVQRRRGISGWEKRRVCSRARKSRSVSGGVGRGCRVESKERERERGFGEVEGEEVRSSVGREFEAKEVERTPGPKHVNGQEGRLLGGRFFLGNEPRPTEQERHRLAGKSLCGEEWNKCAASVSEWAASRPRSKQAGGATKSCAGKSW